MYFICYVQNRKSIVRRLNSIAYLTYARIRTMVSDPTRMADKIAISSIERKLAKKKGKNEEFELNVMKFNSNCCFFL